MWCDAKLYNATWCNLLWNFFIFTEFTSNYFHIFFRLFSHLLQRSQIYLYMWCNPAKGTPSHKTKFHKKDAQGEWGQNDQNRISAKNRWKRHVATPYWSLKARSHGQKFSHMTWYNMVVRHKTCRGSVDCMADVCCATFYVVRPRSWTAKFRSTSKGIRAT